MNADYYGLAVGLMCASAAETIYDRELRRIVEREVMSNPPAAIPPVSGWLTPERATHIDALCEEVMKGRT